MDPRQQEIADYMQEKFRRTLHEIREQVPIPKSWSLDMLLECDHSVRILALAFRNQSKFFGFYMP